MYRRKIAVLAMTLILALPWCAAAARPVSQHGSLAIRVSAAEVLRAGFWGWLRGVWTKEGCTIDPGGKPACGLTSAEPPATPASNADAGCTIDPGGSPCGGRQ
jgi:hypothetical protein